MIHVVLNKYREIWALEHAISLLKWDIETYMPPGGVFARSEAVCSLQKIQMAKLRELGRLLEKVDEDRLASDFERGVVRVLKRDVRLAERVPEHVWEELGRYRVRASLAWREAKREADFSRFRPYLEVLVDLIRLIADRISDGRGLYDVLLDLYEEGLTSADFDAIMNELIPGIKAIVEKVLSEGRPTRDELEDVPYNVAGMRQIVFEVARMIGLPLGHKLRIDESPHPFTTHMSIDDVRITVRYEGRDFKNPLLALLHEGGHALYYLLIDSTLEMTPLAKAASLGFSEGLARFWEVVVGKSRAFLSLICPLIRERLGISKDVDCLYRYFNLVKPCLIRVNADELTYNLHIAVRYEIEKKLINGELSVSDIPSAWNDLYEHYLGLRPKDDAEGVLQDIHWALGLFGYFPTYVLGNIIAAMIWKSFPELNADIGASRFWRITEFLRERICKYGATYPPKELLKRAFGVESYDVSAFLEFARWKYLANGI